MVQVPKLQRLEQSSTPSMGRIDIQAQNNASSILGTTSAVKGLAQEGAELYQDIEDNKIKTLSQEVEQEYSRWNTQELAKLKSYQGDPTDAYVQYDKDSKERYDSIIAARPDLNERVKSHVTGHLNKVRDNESYQALKQRGAQQETYENNLFESSVSLKRNNLALNAGHIQKDNPGSYLPFEENINDLKTLISQRAVKQGTAKIVDKDATEFTHMYRDGDGNIVKVKMDNIAKQRTAKELSKGVSDSITGMINSGYTEEAKQAFERYKGYIDPKTKGVVEKKFKTTDIKDAAYKLVNGIESKPESEQLAAIEKISDAETKSEVLKIIDTNSSRRKRLKANLVNENYETLAKSVMNRMNSDNPFNGLAELEGDPIYKQTWDNLDAKTRKSITEMVKSPEKTNPKSEANIQSLIFGQTDTRLEDVSPEQFQNYLSGLNSADRSKYTNIYNRLNMQSAGEERSTFKRAREILTNQFIVDEHISKNKYGRFEEDDEKILINAQNKLIDYLDTRGNLSDKELKDFVTEFSAAEIKGKVFNPTPRPVFNRAGIQNRSTNTSNVELSPADMIKMKNQFKEVNGYFPTTKDEKFKNFVNTNLK